MRRRCFYGAQHALCCLLASAIAPALWALPRPEPKPAVDLRQSPTGGKTPVEVAVGLYITNFVAIDETRETFEVGGLLTGEWEDPRLALPAGSQQETPRTFRLEELWSPAIEGANTISHRTNQYTLEADRNGKVTYRERFEAVYSNDFALEKFPFDTQVLKFEFQPFLSTASRFDLRRKHFRGRESARGSIQNSLPGIWKDCGIRQTRQRAILSLPRRTRRYFKLRPGGDQAFMYGRSFCRSL